MKHTLAPMARMALRSGGSNPLDNNRVAVAPFDVLDPSLSLWREGLVDVLYASNIMEDWEGLRDLRDYMLKRRPDLLILTNVLQNPLTAAEQVAFRDALFVQRENEISGGGVHQEV